MGVEWLLGFALAAGVPVIAGAVAWGGLKTQVGALREAVTKLEASRDRFGERLGEAEGRIRLLRHTSARGVPMVKASDED
jgi:hypothetical protein